jgi:Stress responsive A/B Barrel Domain
VIRHVSLLTFTPEATDAQIDAIAQALSGLPARLPKLRSYTFGRDAGINTGQASFAVVADFDTVDDYLEYRDDAEHRRILSELITPVLAARSASQYEI